MQIILNPSHMTPNLSIGGVGTASHAQLTDCRQPLVAKKELHSKLVSISWEV